MPLNEQQEQSDERTFEIILEARSLLSQLLTTDLPAPSGPIVRKFDTHKIQELQDNIRPDDHPQGLVPSLRQATILFENHMRLTHPHCFTYIPACLTPIASLGNFPTSIWNVNSTDWDTCSGPSEIQKTMILWLGAQLGLHQVVSRYSIWSFQSQSALGAGSGSIF
ncbi:hypothetical protein ASPBRDRAFT_33048 [Aspergillus brasiliensis CBS 101740]|uniref:Uncharacterized protein n=1 Tax=Aspergillus brasiliensis (strain CBS 101740 / IMI 381727 / IBT 21946) TaxID=767769 RepID=A0A1L9UA61_ASPBC|nr:hypothetical protein ASPBRDRAFT_33048 [Aspergillus brasiliensis CBS 101740]